MLSISVICYVLFALEHMICPMIPKGRETSSMKMYPRYMRSFHVIWVIVMASDSDENTPLCKNTTQSSLQTCTVGTLYLDPFFD